MVKMVKKMRAKEAKAGAPVVHIGNRQISILWWIIALIVIDVCVYLFLGKNSEVLSFTTNMLTITFSVLAVIAAGMVYFGVDYVFGDEKKTFLFIGIGVLLRLIAEIIWIYVLAVNVDVVHLSLADVFWYLSYLSIFIGLAYQIKKTFIFNKAKVVAWALGIATAIVAVLAYHFMGEVAGLSQAEAITHALLEIYVVFDIFVVALLAILIIPMGFSYNKIFQSYVLIALGFVVFAIYDFIYAEMSLTNAYSIGSLVDIMWDSAYILIFGGLLLKYFFLKGGVEDD